MRLLGGVFDDREPIGQSGGQHHVHGGAHGDHVQVDVAALEPSVGHLGAHKAVFHFHVRPQGPQTLQVLVDGSAAEVTAAGQRHFCLAKTPQKRAKQVIAGTDFTPGLIGHRAVMDGGAVHLHRRTVDGAHVGPQFLEDIEHQGHIADLRQVANAAHAIDQQSSGNDTDSGILGPADLDFAIQRSTAVNEIFFQKRHLIASPAWPGW